MIEKTISHYRILEKLGEGGMGVVYKALDTKLKRIVALKFLPPELTRDTEAKERFIQEAQAASALDHPNICNIHEIDETEDGQLFIVMACYEGETLKEKLKHGALAVDEASDIIVQVANGLSVAHEAGITHRDIKPANIMITKRSEVKILDFGLAKLAGQTRITKTGMTLDTVAYMSPEQAQGEQVDHRTDIWSLGVVFYEMLTGELPFKGEYPMAIIYSILNESPKPICELLQDIPSGLEQILDKCLSKNLDQRYDTATALSNDIRLMLGKSSIPTQSIKRELIKKIKNRPLRLAAMVVGIVLVLAIVTMVTLQFFKSKQQPTEVSIQDMPSIAVMYFEDNTGNEDAKWLSRGLPHMLISSLEQIPDLQVIGYQKLHDILKELGKENIEQIDKTTATEIAKKAHAKTMLLGSIFKWENNFRVDYQLQEVATGNLLSANKVIEQNPFDLADKLSMQIRYKLNIEHPLQNSEKIRAVTTNSLEAYRFYLQGKEFIDKAQWKNSWESLSNAVKIDSCFAMAYLDMGSFGANVVSQEKADSMLAKAVKFSDRTSERERLVILLKNADNKGRVNDFKPIAEQLIQKYPAYAEAYFHVGMFHYDRWEFDESLKYWKHWAELNYYSRLSITFLIEIFVRLNNQDSMNYYINKLNEFYPNDAISLLFSSFSYLIKEKSEKAIKIAKDLINRNPMEPWSYENLGIAYFFASEYDSAEIQFEKEGKAGWISASIGDIVFTRIYRGKLKRTFDYLVEKKNPSALWILYEILGKKRKAEEMFPKFKKQHQTRLDRNSDLFISDSLTYAILEKYYQDQIDDAIRLCHRQKEEIERMDLGKRYIFINHFYHALILYSSGFFSEAEKEYAALVELKPEIFVQYRLADCLYKQNKYKEAKVTLKRITRIQLLFDFLENIFSTIESAYAYPRTFYLLGLIEEALGEPAEAIQAYQKLLDIWKEADEDLPEKIDAKERLAKLIKEK